MTASSQCLRSSSRDRIASGDANGDRVASAATDRPPEPRPVHPQPAAPRGHRTYELEEVEELVPSSRLDMPERVSIEVQGEPRSGAMIALGIARVAFVAMSTTLIIPLGAS